MTIDRVIQRLYRAWRRCETVPSSFVFYDEKNDTLKFIAKPVLHYAVVQDSEVDIYRETGGSDQIVGCRLNGFSRVVQRLYSGLMWPPSNPIEVDDVLHRLAKEYRNSGAAELDTLCRSIADMAAQKKARINPSAKRDGH